MAPAELYGPGAAGLSKGEVMKSARLERLIVSAAVAVATMGAAGFLGLSMTGCAADEPGSSKTVKKTTEETPEGTKTTTYTHEKETKVIDK